MPDPATVPAEDDTTKISKAGRKTTRTPEVELWDKRRGAAETVKEDWEKEYRVKMCYQFWKGEQLANPNDKHGNRKSVVNKIHAEVSEALPSLYFYTPHARITAQPELVDTPGTQIDEQAQLMQDTVNHLIRVPTTRFDMSTRMATKEAHWAMGVVEVGYEPDFIDAPSTDGPRPTLREDNKVKGADGPELREFGAGFEQEEGPSSEDMATLPDTEITEIEALETELQSLKQDLKGEHFYVKHIPTKQFLISQSDKPILEDNDWVGYWEDVPVEDVKRSPAYAEAALNLEAISPGDDDKARNMVDKTDDESGNPKRTRLYKYWDLRNKEKIVTAEGHPTILFRETFKRCPLKMLRFDIDPYHFLPIPPLTHKLDSQVEYNLSRDYLRQVRNGTVPRYTYDQDAIEAEQLTKLERGDMGMLIPRKGGTPGADAIVPINQPSLSENALRTLTLSAKEMAEVGQGGGDARQSQQATATQAKIAEAKTRAKESYARVVVAKFLADVAKELLMSAIDNMLIDKWVAMNVAPDSMYAPMEAQKIQQEYEMITGAQLRSADSGIEWDLSIDIEALSPVSEEEKFQKWMQGLSFIGNPGMAMVFSAAPDLLKYTLKLMGLRSSKEQEMIVQGLSVMTQMQQAQAAGGGASPGVSPMAGSATPGNPSDGGPQPGGPTGPGASPPA